MKLPITALIATKNEESNISKCIKSVNFCQSIHVIDSYSSDNTQAIAKELGATVTNFDQSSLQYPKKRQWLLESGMITTPWILVVDADEVVSDELKNELRECCNHSICNGYFIKKSFHFLEKKLRFGGFSFNALVFFRNGTAKYEELPCDPSFIDMDMEVHERIILTGRVGKLSGTLLHDDWKSYDHYVSRHVAYSKWESYIRYRRLKDGVWGPRAISSNPLKDLQTFRRFLKSIIIRLPFEPALWFLYHYFFRLGLLEGKKGLLASQVRFNYISLVRSRLNALKIEENTSAHK